jgi:hypothetical protein
MKFKYSLPKQFVKTVAGFEEFRNGATQVTVRMKNGKIYEKVLISNSAAIVAMRDHEDLPFSVEDIAEIFQTADDRNPSETGNWKFWDDWNGI